ncbi:1727_t:CDS:2, partial [Scutellospora calospora]
MVLSSPLPQSTISPTDNNNNIIINSDFDFPIYSQETNSSTTEAPNDFYPNIGQVGHVDGYVDSYTTFDNHIQSSPLLENLGYTQLDQSINFTTSPHGNSINNNPSLNLHTNNVFNSPHSSPFSVTTSVEDNNILTNSPYLLFSPYSPCVGVVQPTHLISTPGYSDLGTININTPVLTPLNIFNTPYEQPSDFEPEPYFSDTSRNTTPYIAPQTPDTPYTPFIDQQLNHLTLKDPELYEKSYNNNWFSLFPNNHNSIPQYINMATISQNNVSEVEKKLDISSESTAAVVPGTPNSTSTSEKSPSLIVPEHASEDSRPSITDVNDVINSGTKSPNHSSDSTHTTPVNTPHLVAIRPRKDDEPGDHSEPIRRSKRQKRSEKVHECSVCRKPFSRKDAWKRHNATCGK